MPQPATPLRADARRNREQLVAAASAALASGAETFSLDAVAKRAGLGSGTLYRHFPTREDLVEEVYRNEVAPLHDAARSLLDAEPPATALLRWLSVFAEWATAKKGVCEALVAMSSSGRFGTGPVCDQVLQAMRMLLDAGTAAGDLRDDIDPIDLGVITSGLLTAAGAPDQRDQLERLFTVVVDGLRVR
jgi:AcrR family transcriptional regulator